jgi:hypothetical protein
MDYRWTSYGACVKGEDEELVDTGFVLAQFSRNRRSAMRGYERFMRDRIDQGHRKEYYEVKDQRFLGEDNFVEEVRRGRDEEGPCVYDISIAEIVSEVSSVLRIPSDLVYSDSRNRRGALGRAVVGYVGRKLARASGETICGAFPSGSRRYQSRNAKTGGAAPKGRHCPRSRERNRRNAD